MFQLVDDRIQISVALVDVDTGLQTFSEEFTEDYDDIFEVQSQIAVLVATAVRRELTGEEAAILATPESTSTQAYEAYLQGAEYLLEGERESTEVAFAQPLHNTVLVDLKALGDLQWR